MKKRFWFWLGGILAVIVLLGGLVSQTPKGKAMTETLLTPDRVMEYGKDPGLGVRELHKQGYTGKGVTVAIIDQPIRRSHHLEYRHAPITYYEVRPEDPGMKQSDTSMHGPAVTSLLLGNSLGVAPDVTLQYVAMPSWQRDQTAHAEALHKLIEVNRSLPEGKKIRAISISDAVDPTEQNPEAFRQAIADTEAAGIWVFTVDFPDLRLAPLGIDPFKDKDQPANYRQASWVQGRIKSGEFLWIPTDNRTRATEIEPSPYHYDETGGMSWAMPYLVGVVALGLQEDPALTRENAVKYLWESATPWQNGRIINPPGFVKLVKQHKR